MLQPSTAFTSRTRRIAITGDTDIVLLHTRRLTWLTTDLTKDFPPFALCVRTHFLPPVEGLSMPRAPTSSLERDA